MPNLQTPPHAIFHQIQANLRDRYNSGFPVLKELIQNAEDAKARIVQFIAQPGWADAKNPLLRVPGFLVVNDGGFRKRDVEGLLSFAASVKGDETAAIGRFGFGQKAVFHLCDAFVAHAFGHPLSFTEVINPCLGVIATTRAGSWDRIEREDLARLETEVRDIARGFLLWVPLRCEEILPAPKLCFSEARPTLSEIVADFSRHTDELRLLLASLRHIDLIELREHGTAQLKFERKEGSERMLGPDDNSRCHTRAFKGVIAAHAGKSLTYVGRETGAISARLASLSAGEDWPQSPVFTDDGQELRREKAVAHGAVILAEVEGGDTGGGQTAIDWGVFLPVETAAWITAAAPALRLLLHGYFFVDSGRRYIEGFESGTAAGSIRAHWNAALRDDVVLPLLPAVLHSAFEAQILSSDQLAALVTALRSSPFGRTHAASIAAHTSLVRALGPVRSGSAARWRLASSEESLRPLPAPKAAGRSEAVDLFPGLLEFADTRGLTLVCGPEATLTRDAPSWAPVELAELLTAVKPDVFRSAARAGALAAFLALAVGEDDHRRTAVAEPLLVMLRRALSESHPFAPEEAVRGVLANLPTKLAIGLPKSAGERRDVLRVLAGVGSAPPCLRGEWLPNGAARDNLALAEAAPLLAALAPLLQDDQAADAAGTAAMAIIRLLGTRIAEAVRHPDFATLRILRVGDGSGRRRLVTLAELEQASVDGRLFRDSPNVQRFLKALSEAAPDADALVLGGDAAGRLAEIGAPFVFAEARNEFFARVVAHATHFGAASARARLLERVFTEIAAARGALRALAAGDVRAGREGTRLFALSQRQVRLDDLASCLLAGSVDELVVPADIVDRLSRDQVSHLGVETLDGPRLGGLLRAHDHRLTERLLDDGIVTALLESDVPDADLAALPIFPDQSGIRRCAADLWRETADWPAPPAFAGIVSLLRTPATPASRERADKLVRPWSPEAQIRVALDQPEPHCFATEILLALARARSPDLDRLRKIKWLTDRQGRAWAPEDVLDLPVEVLSAARGAFGSDDDLPFLPLSDLSPAHRDAEASARLRDLQILPYGGDAVEGLLLMIAKAKPIAFMGEPNEELASALSTLAERGADLKLPGWPLLAALLRLVPHDRGALLRRFGAVKHNDSEHAVAWMNVLADLNTFEDKPSRAAYAEAFRLICGWPSNLLHEVMTKVRAPVRSGVWVPAREVAARVEGIAPAHRLHEALERFWPDQLTDRGIGVVRKAASASPALPVASGSLTQREASSAQSLIPVLQRAAADLPPEALALLVGVVRRTTRFRDIARQQGLTEGVIDLVWRSLKAKVDDAFRPTGPGQNLDNIRQKTLVQFQLRRPNSVEVDTLAGVRATLPTASLEPLLVIGDGHRRRQKIELGGGDYWLRFVTIADAEGPVSPDHIRRLIRTVAAECLGYQSQCLEALDQLIDNCLKIEQTTVDDACARLEDGLPQILAQLKPAPGTALRNALQRFQTKQQSIPVGDERLRKLPGLKHGLWQELLASQATAELLSTVRDSMVRYGYGPARVIFELFQNADDASIQYPPPGEARFRLEIASDRLLALHWGRLINHLGPEPQVGELKGWQHDLFNMLLMNLSEKREEATGRFGLGFKSVHLIAREVGIASGFAACRVRGGMLPEVWKGGRQVSHDRMAEGRRATVIDLEIDADWRNRTERALDEFRRAARWLPAMSRAIRRIEIQGDGQSIWTADLAPTAAEGVKIVTLRGAQPGRALALDLGEETTLFLPLDADGPTPEQEGLPRLWLLAPLEETLRTGWLMNGMRFRVDPGRARLAGTEEERQASFVRLGAVLGARLVALHDMVREDWASFAAAAGLADPNPETGANIFLRRLADLFSRDFFDPLARGLHGPERGFGRLIADRLALPTGLPRPFAPFLCAAEAKHELTGALADAELLTELSGWKAIASFGRASVSAEAAGRLEALGFGRPRLFGIAEVLRQEIGPERRIDPALARRLGRVLTEERLQRLRPQDKDSLQGLLASAEFSMADCAWRYAALPPRDAADADEEERRVLAFAPDRVVAISDYRGPALGLYRLARRQSGFQQSDLEFARWAASENDLGRQKALLRYVLEGRQGSSLATRLADRRPSWLPETSDRMRGTPLVDDLPEGDQAKLLSLLYPKENLRRWATTFQDSTQIPPPDGEPEADPADFLEETYDWWVRDHQDVRKRHDQMAYPDGFLPSILRDEEAADDREGWFTFFALGIFRTIGRSHEGAHRKFIDTARQAGWWAKMALARLPNDPKPWTSRLEDFARADAWRIDYPQWRRALADLYVLARWLPEYVDAFRSLPTLIRQNGSITLSEAWRLSASPLWQRRGLEGAPLTQSLGPGANWLIREAIRHGLWPERDAILMHPYGWAATARLRRLFSEELRFPLAERASMDLSPDIFRFVQKHLRDRAGFLGDLDLPLQTRADGRYGLFPHGRPEREELFEDDTQDDPDECEVIE
jgi:hypothetical protein